MAAPSRKNAKAAKRLPEQARILSQPPFRNSVLRKCILDMLPESLGVIHLLQVHQLMDNDVVTNKIGRLNQPPVQCDALTDRT